MKMVVIIMLGGFHNVKMVVSDGFLINEDGGYHNVIRWFLINEDGGYHNVIRWFLINEDGGYHVIRWLS